MSLAVNEQSSIPPGFRFHPTEEELLHYYLRKRVASEKIDFDVIRDVDLNKLEPWDIQERCKIGSAPQNDWYFFSHKDKKYPTGTRTNRATTVGFWKATGRDKIIYSGIKRIGMRKTLVFYQGRAPHGQKSDWIMHEYRLDDHTSTKPQSNLYDPINAASSTGESNREDGWVVCRIFKKRNHQKELDNPYKSSTAREINGRLGYSSHDGSFDQILPSIGSDNNFNNLKGIHDRLLQIPPLDHTCSSQSCYTAFDAQVISDMEPGLRDWAALDRLVGSHFNYQSETTKEFHCFNDPNPTFCSTNRFSSHDCKNDMDMWRFAQSSTSSSDPLCYVSQSSI